MARGIRPVSLFDDEEDIRDPYAIAKGFGIAGGVTIPKLIMERNHDIKLVNEYIKQNLASRGSPLLSQSQWGNTYGSKLPNKLFEKASGTPGSLKGWLTGRTHPSHFGPVEKGIKFVKGIMPTIMNVGSKLPKFPNPVMTVLQGLAPKALGDGMIDEPNFTPFEQPTTNVAQPTTPVGTSATALAQIQANIDAAKAKSTVQPTVNNVSPGGGNSRRQTTQSVAPAPRSRARATRGRTAPVIRQNRIGGRYGL